MTDKDCGSCLDGCAQCEVHNIADIRRIVRQRLEAAVENLRMETERLQRANRQERRSGASQV